MALLIRSIKHKFSHVIDLLKQSYIGLQTYSAINYSAINTNNLEICAYEKIKNCRQSNMN